MGAPQGGEWIQEHVSDDFLVDSGGDADVYSLTADWISGYPTAFYDVQIDLRDADTGALVAAAGSERPELSRIPLEDQVRDTRVNPRPERRWRQRELARARRRRHRRLVRDGAADVLVWGRMRPLRRRGRVQRPCRECFHIDSADVGRRPGRKSLNP